MCISSDGVPPEPTFVGLPPVHLGTPVQPPCTGGLTAVSRGAATSFFRALVDPEKVSIDSYCEPFSVVGKIILYCEPFSGRRQNISLPKAFFREFSHSHWQKAGLPLLVVNRVSCNRMDNLVYG
jgi:hypothetical protein